MHKTINLRLVVLVNIIGAYIDCNNNTTVFGLTMTLALSITDLHKSFNENEVIKGMSLTANKGDVISLIGASGSGKSTFLRCINLLETPNSGEVRVAGELIEMKTDSKGNRLPTSQKQVDRIRTKLGMVFQSFNLWSHMTILENVMEAQCMCWASQKTRLKLTPCSC